MANAKVKNRRRPPSSDLKSAGVLSGACAPRALTAGEIFPRRRTGPTTTTEAAQLLTGHHHGVETGGSWQAVTSACPRHPLRALLQRLKRRAHSAKLQSRLRSIKWLGPLPSKEDPRAVRAPGSERFDPQRVQASAGHLGACLE
jgi:hypothetical protein